MSCFSFFSLLPLLLLQTSIATVAHQDDLPNLTLYSKSSPAQTPGLNVSTAWTARKDITRYSSLLLKKETQKLAVFLRNVVYSVFTGVYHITIGVSFYPSHNPKIITDNSGFEFVSNNIADLILPISRNVESKDGLWFPIENSADEKQIKEFKIPQNAYRAVLEVNVSPIDIDDVKNQLIPITRVVGRDGPFRDVVIRLDDVVVGEIWPYPVIFGAGNDMWNPVASIGCFDLPSYDIELTPFLGTLLNGGIHNLSFGIGNAVSVWYIDANLHICSRVEQFILSNDSISFVKNSSTVPNFLSFDSVKKFTLSNKDEMVPSSTGGDGNDVQRTDIETGYDDEKTCNDFESGAVMTTSLKDQQIGNGVWIVKNFSWLDEVLDMKQLYNYKNVGDNSKVCYLRSIATSNATIVYDKEDVKC
ncbi:unnamed protein product [Linum trigynum]|uniref:Peptide N-acetyl-beta-D-glucosaminyl asparaginase amidase A N-terminal domain-containing protein n=1 Tax=Linum trigynum TaxID=586398 RepID=A0AAV2DWL1_9ROSI